MYSFPFHAPLPTSHQVFRSLPESQEHTALSAPVTPLPFRGNETSPSVKLENSQLSGISQAGDLAANPSTLEGGNLAVKLVWHIQANSRCEGRFALLRLLSAKTQAWSQHSNFGH